ncbi:MAG: DUF5615 family PIN-like protein [Candidatus Limnocylindrales bacterium]
MTRLLRDHGQLAMEVRDVLGGDAPDAAISAYAKANALWVATKDREFAQRRRAAGEPTLWLQTRQTEDVERLRTRLQTLVDAVDAGASQAVIARDGALEVEA